MVKDLLVCEKGGAEGHAGLRDAMFSDMRKDKEEESGENMVEGWIYLGCRVKAYHLISIHFNSKSTVMPSRTAARWIYNDDELSDPSSVPVPIESERNAQPILCNVGISASRIGPLEAVSSGLDCAVNYSMRNIRLSYKDRRRWAMRYAGDVCLGDKVGLPGIIRRADLW